MSPVSAPRPAERRWLPNPALSVAIFVVWLMLARGPAARMILLGAVWAVAIPWLARALLPTRQPIRSWGTLLAFAPRFLWDLVVANVTVAALALNPVRRVRPRWIVIPLDVEHPYGITMLASVISLTPGTVSAELGADRRTLLVHALDLRDGEAEVRRIKERYEAPILRIFGS